MENKIIEEKGIMDPNYWRSVLGFDESEQLSLRNENIKLFACNSNPRLAQDIADYLEIPLGNAVVSRFTNGEIKVKIEESVRGNEVFIVQSMNSPVNDHLMELLIMCDALQRASANSVYTIVPYFGYAKQEKKTTGREPITAKLVANIMTVAGASKVITMDLHAAAIQGFFDIPVDNLFAMPLFVHYYRQRGLWGDNIVVASPDAGGVARAKQFAEKLDAPLAIIFKRRPKPDVADIINVVGEVAGKNVVILDDMISTGGTLVEGAKMLKSLGARDIYACATHAIFAGKAIPMIEDSHLTEVLVTDTIPVDCADKCKKIKLLSVAAMLGEAVRCNFFNTSVSRLFF